MHLAVYLLLHIYWKTKCVLIKIYPRFRPNSLSSTYRGPFEIHKNTLFNNISNFQEWMSIVFSTTLNTHSLFLTFIDWTPWTSWSDGQSGCGIIHDSITREKTCEGNTYYEMRNRSGVGKKLLQAFITSYSRMGNMLHSSTLFPLCS